MRVIVCGGRDLEDQQSAFAALDALHASRPITVVVHGAARGADLIGQAWAKARGAQVEAHPADWEKFRRSAGPRRNQEMADSGADLCIALPGGKGTADMCRRAQAAGIPVVHPLCPSPSEPYSK